MADPMTPERLAEIRERAESVRTWKAVWGPPIPQLCDADVPDLLAEVERLRAELAEARKGRTEQMLGRLDDWAGDLAAVVAERDAARTELADLRVKADRYVDRIQTLARKHSRAVALRATLRDLLRIQERCKHEARTERDRARADAKNWHDTYQQHAGAVDAFLGELLELLPGATGADAYDQIPRGIRKLTADRDRLARQVWILATAAQRDGHDPAAAVRMVTAAEAERDEARADRDRLAEQIKRVRDRHPRKTDSTDCTDGDTALGCQHDLGYHTVEYCGLCHEPWPCAEIRNLDGTEAG